MLVYIVLYRSDWENIFEVHTEETLPPKKLPEKEVVAEDRGRESLFL